MVYVPFSSQSNPIYPYTTVGWGVYEGDSSGHSNVQLWRGTYPTHRLSLMFNIHIRVQPSGIQIGWLHITHNLQLTSFSGKSGTKRWRKKGPYSFIKPPRCPDIFKSSHSYISESTHPLIRLSLSKRLSEKPIIRKFANPQIRKSTNPPKKYLLLV